MRVVLSCGQGRQAPDYERGFVLSIKATAPFLGVPEATVRKLVNEGDMRHVRFGQRIYITREQINDFLQANTHAGYVGRW